MASEWLPALFGVIGTLLGGSVTLTANWISSSTQRYLATEDRNQQNAAIRREAYASLLASASMLKDRGRELAESIIAERPDEERITSLHKVYYDSWEDVKERRPLALIVGPIDMPAIINELHYSLAAFSACCDKMFQDRPDSWPANYDKLACRVDVKFAAFAEAAGKWAIAGESGTLISRASRSSSARASGGRWRRDRLPEVG